MLESSEGCPNCPERAHLTQNTVPNIDWCHDYPLIWNSLERSLGSNPMWDETLRENDYTVPAFNKSHLVRLERISHKLQPEFPLFQLSFIYRWIFYYKPSILGYPQSITQSPNRRCPIRSSLPWYRKIQHRKLSSLILPTKAPLVQSGWWLTKPYEKWWSESQLGWWNSRYIYIYMEK